MSTNDDDDVQETRSDPTAIFIDFECLMGKPPHPALLGVLIGSDGEDLEQLIIDPELTPARVANRGRTRAVEAADAVRSAYTSE